jgi:uncharacterized repeat protein (TIGR01451 family)
MSGIMITRPISLSAALFFSILLLLVSACQTVPVGGGESTTTTTVATPERESTPRESIRHQDRIRVQKTTLQRGDVGQELVYRIQVEALRDAENVRVTETLPEGFTFVRATPQAQVEGNNTLRWHFTSLSRGARETIEVRVQPGSEGDHTLCTVVTFDQRFCLDAFAGRPLLAVVKEGPPEVELGDEVRWTVRVTNRGSAAAKNVVVTDELPDAFEPTSPLRQQLGTIEPGATREVTYSARAVTQGEFRNRAHVAYDGAPTGADALDEQGRPLHASAQPIRVVQSGVRISHSGPEEGFVFKPESYRIRIENTGDTDLQNVRITNDLDGALTVSDPAGGRVRGNAIGWLIPNLPAGSAHEIETKVSSTRTGELRSVARLITAAGLESSDSVTTLWKAVPGLTISLTDSVDPIRVDEETVYTIVVRNQGDFEPVSGTLELSLSEQLKAVSAAGDSVGEIDGQLITFPRITLEPGRDIRLTVTARGNAIGPGRAILRFTADFIEEAIVNQEATNVY